LKEKFHNFELVVVLKSKAARIAQPLAAKGGNSPAARVGLRVDGRFNISR
jgi:hypothetical protein